MSLNEHENAGVLPVDLLVEAFELAMACEEEPFASDATLGRVCLQMTAARTDYDRATAEYREINAALRDAARREDDENKDRLSNELLECLETRTMNAERVRDHSTQLKKLMQHHKARQAAREVADAG